MKSLVFTLLFSTQLWANNNCPKEIALEGQIISFAKEGETINEEEFYVPLADKVNEHSGDFRNIRLKSDYPFERLEIFGKVFLLQQSKKDKKFKKTKDLYLLKELRHNPTAHFEIKFLGKNIECIKKFKGITRD